MYIVYHVTQLGTSTICTTLKIALRCYVSSYGEVLVYPMAYIQVVIKLDFGVTYSY